MALVKHGQSFKTMAITINGTGTLTGVSVGGLPDGIVDTDMLAASAVTAAKASGSAKGVTMVDSWVVTSNFSAASSTDITSNWAKHSDGTAMAGTVGTGMTESSGIFTFPSTGIYMVHHTMSGQANSGARPYLGMRQYYSTNSGSNFTTTSSGYSSGTSSTDHFVGSGTVIYDVTDASTHRIKFNVEPSTTATYFGVSVNKNTGVVFIRLGDT